MEPFVNDRGWRGLFPLAFPVHEAVFAVAFGAKPFLVSDGPSIRLVFLHLEKDLLRLVASEATRGDFVPGIHDLRRRAVAPRSPGFIRDVFIASAVALGAADVGLGVFDRQLLLHEVHVAHRATAVVRHRFAAVLGFRRISRFEGLMRPPEIRHGGILAKADDAAPNRARAREVLK